MKTLIIVLMSALIALYLGELIGTVIAKVMYYPIGR